MPKLDEYVRIREAAEYLSACRDTLRNWGRTGKIPEYRHPVNDCRLYNPADVDKHLEQIHRSTVKKRTRRTPNRPR